MKTAFYRPSNLTIEVHPGDPFGVYEIDLERTTDSARMLDWIFQIRSKRWATPEIMYDLLTAFDEACKDRFDDSVQGVFCPSGQDQKVNWKAKRKASE